MKNTLSTLYLRIERNESGCWNWTGRIHDGYGYVSWEGRPRRAHRVMYEQIVGRIGEGLDLDHLCRNRACINPEHLEPVTRSENLRRSPFMKVNNGNALKTHCRNGHPFNETNTYTDSRGGRHCRTCNRASAARTQQVRINRQSRSVDRMIDPSQAAA